MQFFLFIREMIDDKWATINHVFDIALRNRIKYLIKSGVVAVVQIKV